MLLRPLPWNISRGVFVSLTRTIVLFIDRAGICALTLVMTTGRNLALFRDL